MIEIIPAIIPKNLDDMSEKLALVQGAVSTVQIDITDGVFAGRPSWPFGAEEELQRMIRESEGLPFWEDFMFESDLMIARAAERAEDFFRAGFSRAVFHLGSTDDMRKALSIARDYDIETGIALLPSESPDLLEEYEGSFQFVQCMGIARIGFQGESFDAHAVDNIRRVRERFPDIIISVDGGVSEHAVPILAGAGVDRLVVGSAIFHTDDPKEAVARLFSIANAYNRESES